MNLVEESYALSLSPTGHIAYLSKTLRRGGAHTR